MAQAIYSRIDHEGDLIEMINCDSSVHDPSKTGYNYNTFIAQNPGRQRERWPMPVENVQLVWTNTGTSDCKKKGKTIINKRARTGLWIWTCMIHERIIGFHIIRHGEGRRDCLLSLYRFKERPPKVVFVDCACQAEESGLNWLPKYFETVTFYHDIFHGYSHKCSDRYSSRFNHSMRIVNTSVMEQINSFLQPLRRILSSSTTKVGTRRRLSSTAASNRMGF